MGVCDIKHCMFKELVVVVVVVVVVVFATARVNVKGERFE